MEAKTMKKLVILIGLLVVCGIASLTAQPLERFQAGGHFSLGMPQGEFQNAVDRMGYGGRFYFLTRIQQSPLLVGGSFDFMIYGYDRYEAPFSHTIPNVYVDVTTTNAMFSGYFQARLQPRSGRIRPYVDGLIGLNFLTTDVRVGDSDHDWESDGIAHTNLLRDTALSYGGGVGIMLPLFIRRLGRPGGGVGVYMDIGIRYLKGGTADYMTEYSVFDDEYYQTRTDLFSAIIGISVAF
jgi:hypothetical protein